MITVIIADDEQPARERIKTLLKDYPGFEILAEANNGDNLLNAVIQFKPHVVFLDINMPGTSVFTSMESIKDPPLIVFQTAYSQYAVEAFGVEAVDYLVKPVSRERFSRSIERIKKIVTISDSSDFVKKENRGSESDGRQQFISVKDGGAIKVINHDDIYLITSEDGITIIDTKSGRYICDQSLSELETILPVRSFYRVSRSAIIQLTFIDTIHPFFNGCFKIQLHNGTTVELSRRRARLLREYVDF